MTNWRTTLPYHKIASIRLKVDIRILANSYTALTLKYATSILKFTSKVPLLCPAAGGVFDRILQIPTLPWMHGTLTLIMLDAFDDLIGDVHQFDALGPIDHTVMLPSMNNRLLNEGDLKRHYYTVLRACAALGMISGRGVPYRDRNGPMTIR
ncbi:hypothetical protein [Yoonia sp. BS5-3]|uniref:Uncharacterized protein n=1 Tax=Yoonia phaeophyticola TaxID=3137369 RepID=A0ABZ2VA23_9RHOB